MPRRRDPRPVASQTEGSSAFDAVTLHAFMFTVTVATAVLISYGPAAAVHHMADVLASAGSLSLPGDAAWSSGLAY